MGECSHDCGSCGSNCGERTAPQIASSATNAGVKKVIAVMSGKGGVGKSLVTSMLAVNAASKGLKTAILDADITGPSIPKSFGLKDKAKSNEEGTLIIPEVTKGGIKVMSLNLLMENETDPVIWRGPIIASAVREFWQQVEWGDVDVMFIDCPPGTGDVPLTIFQSLPVDGIVVVTSPQELVSMIVTKAVNMARMMDIPVLGIVENMSYFMCPDCGKKHEIYGESHIDEIAKDTGIDTVAKLPMDPQVAAKVDSGLAEELETTALDEMLGKVMAIRKEPVKVKIAVTYDDGQVFQHFGHSKEFKIYIAEDNKVVASKVIGTDGNGHEALAGYLETDGVDVLICGGIGGGAINALAACGIEVVPGVTGSTDEAVRAYLSGELSVNMTPNCNHHEHDHGDGGCHCGGHDDGESCGCGCH
ncbi:MAG: P-loop NTPase [Lachnospira sp.]|nr:P-loop NTPase [Lachnospira sp.]